MIPPQFNNTIHNVLLYAWTHSCQATCRREKKLERFDADARAPEQAKHPQTEFEYPPVIVIIIIIIIVIIIVGWQGAAKKHTRLKKVSYFFVSFVPFRGCLSVTAIAQTHSLGVPPGREGEHTREPSQERSVDALRTTLKQSLSVPPVERANVLSIGG